MTITEFFKHNDNFVTREKIFLDRIMFDLKLAAAHARIPLQIFVPDVDRDGYDIVVDDADLERRFQLKSVLKSSATASWDIHKRLLRPTMYNAQTLGFELSPEGVGLEGGVILIHIDDGEATCPASYSYTDVFVLTAFANGWIVSDNAYRAIQARNALTALGRGSGRDRVPVPVGAFVKLRSPSCLLAVAGFHSVENSYWWWGNMLAAFRANFRVGETPKSIEPEARTITAQAEHAIEGLLSLVADPGLSSFKPRS